MLTEFDRWSAPHTETHSFAAFAPATVAIDADFFLLHLLHDEPSKEPLLGAHGGLPFSFKHYAERDLARLTGAGITPLFVFSGLDVGKKYRPFLAPDGAAAASAKAWALYEQHEADEAVKAFGNTGVIVPRDLYRMFQVVLREQNIAFQVAPYSALAQLALLEKFPQYADIVAASSEILLYDVEKAIVKWNFKDLEITWVKRKSLIEDYGGTPDKFRDACILAGSNILPPLPQLANKTSRIRMAVDLMNRNGETGISVCLQHRDDGPMRKIDYLDRYRRTWLALKHHVVLKPDGKVEPLDLANAPSDFYEFIGQRLPDELYYYLSIGVCGPRVLNWLTSQEILETPPLDGGDSEEYKSVILEKLMPLRTSALSVLSHSLTRAYQHRSIILRCWFDPSRETRISLSELAPPRPILSTWNVRESAFIDHDDFQPGPATLKFAIHYLSDAASAAKTITARTVPNILNTKAEIEYNAMWRFLHLRGYVADDHTLTPWGQVLHAMQTKVNPSTVSEDALLLAVEMLRMDLLHTRNMFPLYSTFSVRGSETDKTNSLIVARIACLGALRHKPIGYTGPLSRYLLAYSSIANAVRRALRDSLETCIVTLLLNGDAVRDADTDSDLDTAVAAADAKPDTVSSNGPTQPRTVSAPRLSDLGLELPLLLDGDCVLGVAMKSYLDDVSGMLYDGGASASGTTPTAAAPAPSSTTSSASAATTATAAGVRTPSSVDAADGKPLASTASSTSASASATSAPLLPSTAPKLLPQKAKDLVKGKGQREWFKHAVNFREDLQRGFDLWDAVVEGVRVAFAVGVLGKGAGGNASVGLEAWEAVDAWVGERR